MKPPSPPSIEGLSRSRGPVFITGPGRSGKTLLAMLLRSHHSFASPLQELALRRERVKGCGTVDECRSRLLRSFSDRGNALSKTSLSTQPSSAGGLLAEVMGQFASETGKDRWIVHSQKWEDEVDSLFRAFPNATVIHMVRDPRDRAAALMQEGRVSATWVKLGLITSEWVHSSELALRNHEGFGERYLVLRYEDLASSPEATLCQVLERIGEKSGVPGALLEHLGEVRTKKGDHQYGALKKDYVGMFETVLTPEQAALVMKLAGRTMARHGYQSNLAEPGESALFRLRLSVVRARVTFRGRYCSKHILRRRIPLDHQW